MHKVISTVLLSNLPSIGCVAVLFCLLVSPILAADFSYRATDDTLLIEGMIVDGDADRMYQQLIDHGPPSFIELDSPGGTVVEALRMAALASAIKTTIRPRKNGICASSCFFLFLAGEPRQAGGKGGIYESIFGTIGLHRPYMSKQFFNSVDSVQSSKSQAALMKNVGAYLESKMVPNQLIEMMMNRPSTEVYWMTAKDIANLGEYSPAREELFTARCGYDREAFERVIMLKFAKSFATESGVSKIEEQLERLSAAYEKSNSCIWGIKREERHESFHLLKVGGKPWTQDQRSNESAAAKWVETGRDESATVVLYVDTSNIRKNGNLVKMWKLLNYKSPQQDTNKKTYLSSSRQEEFDCKGDRVRLIYVAWHSGNMASGNIVSSLSRPSNEWKQIERGGIAETEGKLACGKP